MPGEKEKYTGWEIKFLREGGFMPFGSLMNAWGQINQGKGMDLEEFKKSAEELFKLSLKMIKEAIKEAKEVPQWQVDFPSKTK